MARERIISVDSHAAIPETLVLSHLAPEFHADYQSAKETARQRALAGKPQKQKRAAPQSMPNMGAGAPWPAAGRAGEHDPIERLKDMDIDEVDAEILYTEIGGGAMFYGMRGEGCLAAFQAFNSAALEWASVDPKRLLPVYLLPLHDIDAAVGEVERIAAEGGRAVQLPIYPAELDVAPYWDERYDRLWAAISDAGIPVSQHVGSNAYLGELMLADPTPAKGLFQSLPPIFMAEVLGSWVVTGILERFPKLRVVMVESGLGWIPYYLERLDRMQERHGWNTFEGMLREKPSFYWRRQMAATFEEDEFGIQNRHQIGVENLMWATDYPHPDSTWPDSQKVLHTHFDRVPIEETRLMVAGNAARFYNL
jgi:predicted TIM-barrel fold metal-dependent hydrolase